MKFFKITVLIIVLALVGSTFTVDAKVKKRRSTTKKEKVMMQKNNDVKTEKCGLDMVEYEYSNMMICPVSNVRVERKNGKVVLVTRGTNTDEKEFVIEDGEQLLKQALEIIEQEKMLDYAVSYKPVMQPLDGYAWWFKAQLADGRSVSSHGSIAGPGGDGLNKMQSLLFDRAYKLLSIDF